VSLGACTYEVASNLLIQNKTGLTIEGQGQGTTVVHFARPVTIGFDIRNGTTNLTIRNFTIAGSVTGPLCTKTQCPYSNPPPACYPCYSNALYPNPNSEGIGSFTG